MRKLIGVFLAVVLVFAVLPAVCQAEVLHPGDSNVKVVKFWIGKDYYEIKGTKYSMDVAPYIKNGRTMLPYRYVGYALGLKDGEITWDPVARKVTLTRAGDTVEVWIGKNNWKVNGIECWPLDAAPEIVPPGRTMVPFRAAAQALGALTFWDAKERSVTLVTWENPPEPVEMEVEGVYVTENRTDENLVVRDLDDPSNDVEVQTERPVLIGSGVDFFSDKWERAVDAIEWLKLWGISEEAMIFDPVRGGLIVRGCSRNEPEGSPYVCFYAGEKWFWDGFYRRVPSEKLVPEAYNDEQNPVNYVKDGRFYGYASIVIAPAHISGYWRDWEFYVCNDPKFDNKLHWLRFLIFKEAFVF